MIFSWVWEVYNRPFANVIGTWRQRDRERRELAQLDARSLKDLGLNPSNIQFEVDKPFWRG